jgi:hypothetical protein
MIEDDESCDVKPVEHLSVKQLSEICKHINTSIGFIDDNDASRERTAKVIRATESAVACCKELFSDSPEAAR